MNILKWDGKPISKPGIYSGVPIDVYHGANLCDAPSISSSGLRKIANDSPAHYWCESPYNPDRIEQKETDALTFGRAAHHLLLGEDDFNAHYVVRPDKWDSWRTKEAKEWKSAQEADGRTVLLSNQLDTIRGIARSLANHPLIDAGILNGGIELTMVWRCKDTGVWKKARPDAMPNSSGDFADLKTALSVKDDALRRTIFDYGLHQQGALVGEGFCELSKQKDYTFSLVFAEKEAPFCIRVVTLRDSDLALGERQNFAAARQFAHGIETGEWPGPGSADAEYIGLPDWATKSIEYRLEREVA